MENSPANKKSCKQTVLQTNSPANSPANKQSCKQTVLQTKSPANKQSCKQTVLQTNSPANKKSCKQTVPQTNSPNNSEIQQVVKIILENKLNHLSQQINTFSFYFGRLITSIHSHTIFLER